MTRRAWVVAMAWRDARKTWRRLLVYLSATSLGIGALVAAGSFRANLEEAIRRQARPLLGADLVASHNQPFTEAAESMLASLPYDRAREVRLASMALLPSGDPRLVEVRAVGRGFPFYGEVKTRPAEAFGTIFKENAVLLEENVIAEHGLSVGDLVRIGESEFRLAGALELVPGEAMASVFTAPRAFIDHARLTATGLVRQASMARHRVYFRIEDESERERAENRLKDLAEREGFRLQTVKDRERSLGRQAQNADRFLSLAALAILLLGGVGVASIMQAYVRDKWSIAATLRCLGASSAQVTGIFVFQAAALGLIGSLVGAVLGVLLQALLPQLLAKFTTVPIPFFIAWSSVGRGFATGFVTSFLFSLLPLLYLRRVAPLAAFRFDFASDKGPVRDPAAWIGALAIAGLLIVMAKAHMATLWSAVALPIAIGGALLVLGALTGVALRWLRRHIQPSLPHVWRHGLSNLFRPNNQTFLLVPTLGLGASLLFFISFAQSSLLGHLSFAPTDDQPNLALMDVQTDQRDAVAATLRDLGAPLVEEAPIVSMRLSEIKGRSVQDIRKENHRYPGWALNRVYRSTYRSHLTAGERVIAGQWPPDTGEASVRVPIAMEQEIAEDFDLNLGDTLSFDIQGVEFPVVVAALRKVDWYQLRPNFFFVFPDGSLNDAPQFFVALTRASNAEESARIQRTIRATYPNISTMDLRMTLATLSDYIGKISWLLRIMMLIVVFTGLLVLCGTLLSTRFERLQEAALLRTLGASRATIRGVHLIEYSLTGLFAGLWGLAIGIAAGAGTMRFLFDVPFQPSLAAAAIGVLLMTCLTTATGLFLGRGILRHPPLEILREER